jgi:hypothetical protein
LLRLLQTVAKWVGSTLASSLSPAREHLFHLIPLLLHYDWYERDPQLARDCQIALACLSRTHLPVARLRPLLSVLQGCAAADAWKTRLATLDFLQAFVFNNFMLICSPSLSHEELKADVLGLVMSGLTDQQVEVRVKASQVCTIICETTPDSRCVSIFHV